MSSMIEIEVNGQPQQVAAGQSVAQLIQDLKLQPNVVAVELNLNLIPREQHGSRILAAGDRLEIVSLVGGG